MHELVATLAEEADVPRHRGTDVALARDTRDERLSRPGRSVTTLIDHVGICGVIQVGGEPRLPLEHDMLERMVWLIDTLPRALAGERPRAGTTA